MQKVAILADSIACLTPEMVRQCQLQIIPINIHFDGNIYRNGVDITSAEAYRLLEKAPDYFASSPASVGEYIDAYREAATHAEGILCITLSSKLSTLYDMARVAREEAENELHQTPIEVMDSKTAAEEMRDKVSFFVFLDTVRHVYRSGRIPKIASQAGSILNIKPILTTSSGVLHFAGVARSRRGGVERLLKTMKDRVGPSPVHVAVAHAYALEEAERLKEQISSEFNCAELWVTEFSPLMGYACGTGALAIAFYSDD